MKPIILDRKESLSDLNSEQGIVLPALMWWMGVPLTLLIVLWALGVF